MCELVGSSFLTKFSFIFEKENVGLYRGVGLRVFRNLLGPEIERRRTEIIKVFKDCDLSITKKNQCMKVMDAVDFQCNLTNNTYILYRKPTDINLYTNINSNKS